MAVCPHCGCKGTKTPHTRIAEEATAQEFGRRTRSGGPASRTPAAGRSGATRTLPSCS